VKNRTRDTIAKTKQRCKEKRTTRDTRKNKRQEKSFTGFFFLFTIFNSFDLESEVEGAAVESNCGLISGTREALAVTESPPEDVGVFELLLELKLELELERLELELELLLIVVPEPDPMSEAFGGKNRSSSPKVIW
jgi:hypothetical protein